MFRDMRGILQSFKSKVSFRVSPAGIVTFCVRYEADKFAEESFTYDKYEPLLVGSEVAPIFILTEQSDKHPDLTPGTHVACAATATAHRRPL